MLNQAANALFVKQAQAARVTMAAQALQDCREQNNPYGPFGAPKNLMWATDPCANEEQALAEATTQDQTSASLAQASGQPNPTDLASAPAPQLSDTLENEGPDPAVPMTEFITPSSNLTNMWSPNTVLEIMDMMAEEMEGIQEGSTQIQENMEALEAVHYNITLFLSWDPWGKPKKKMPRINYMPNNSNWINRYMP